MAPCCTSVPPQTNLHGDHVGCAPPPPRPPVCCQYHAIVCGAEGSPRSGREGGKSGNIVACPTPGACQPCPRALPALLRMPHYTLVVVCAAAGARRPPLARPVSRTAPTFFDFASDSLSLFAAPVALPPARPHTPVCIMIWCFDCAWAGSVWTRTACVGPTLVQVSRHACAQGAKPPPRAPWPAPRPPAPPCYGDVD